MVYYCRKCKRYHSSGAIARSHRIFAKKTIRKPKFKPRAKRKPIVKPTAPIKKKVIAPIVKKELAKPKPKTKFPSPYAKKHAKEVIKLDKELRGLSLRAKELQKSPNGRIVDHELKQVNRVVLLWKKLNLHGKYGEKIKYLMHSPKSEEYKKTKRLLNQNLTTLKKYYQTLSKDRKFKFLYNVDIDDRYQPPFDKMFWIELTYKGRYASIKKTTRIEFPIKGIAV
jgi:hypothetical protein